MGRESAHLKNAGAGSLIQDLIIPVAPRVLPFTLLNQVTKPELSRDPPARRLEFQNPIGDRQDVDLFTTEMLHLERPHVDLVILLFPGKGHKIQDPNQACAASQPCRPWTPFQDCTRLLRRTPENIIPIDRRGSTYRQMIPVGTIPVGQLVVGIRFTLGLEKPYLILSRSRHMPIITDRGAGGEHQQLSRKKEAKWFHEDQGACHSPFRATRALPAAPDTRSRVSWRSSSMCKLRQMPE
jgi:hypothetical protein